MVVVVRLVIPDIFGSDGRDGDASCRRRQYNCSGTPLTSKTAVVFSPTTPLSRYLLKSDSFISYLSAVYLASCDILVSI